MVSTGQPKSWRNARIGSLSRQLPVQDYRGRDLIERTIVSDSDIAGDETIEVYRDLWNRADGSQPRLEAAGFRFTTAEVRVTTEQAEPLLLLADYAAGIAHAALIDDPGAIRLPLQPAEARALLSRMHACGKLAIINSAFESTYAEIFGPELMRAAEQLTSSAQPVEGKRG
jgi:hypothetical protein